MYFVIGLIVSVSVFVFLIAPAFVAIAFNYTADTYIGQVKCGLILILSVILSMLLALAVIITIQFVLGDFSIVQRLSEKTMMLIK